MSKLVVTSYQSTPSLGTAVFVQIRDASNGAVLVSRTNGAVREDVSGFYTWSGTLASLTAYEALWDEGGTTYAGEVVIPEPDITISGTVGGLPIQGDANGTLQGLTFLIKRGDTKPFLRRQLVDTNGDAIVLDGTETVKFTMRASTDVTMGGTAKTHASAVIIDAPSGIVEYRWVPADTNTTTYVETSTLGRVTDTPYAAEFEVNFADGNVETFPQGTYIAVSMPPDLDPGITP